MIENITPVIIVKNGALTIEKTLKSLADFKDVVVFDNGSTDETLKIVSKYPNINLIQGDFLGFGPTKILASTYASNDWILSLDSDEVVDISLLDTLHNLELNIKQIFNIKRYNYYRTKKINHCGWGEEKIIRLYNRKKTNFNENLIHEKIITDDLEVITLDGELKHYSYNNVSQFIQKIDYYSDIYAKENVGKKSSSPLKAILKAIFHFIKCYIFKRGFLDGYAGVLICTSGANGVFYKYLKLYEENNKI